MKTTNEKDTSIRVSKGTRRKLRMIATFRGLSLKAFLSEVAEGKIITKK